MVATGGELKLEMVKLKSKLAKYSTQHRRSRSQITLLIEGYDRSDPSLTGLPCTGGGDINIKEAKKKKIKKKNKINE